MNNKIQKVIDEKIRPHLKEHYGDIEFVSFEAGIVSIKFWGNCKGCPQASLTIEQLVKAELVKEIPEIEDVVLLNEVSDELLDFARKILNKSS